MGAFAYLGIMNKWPYSKELENWCHFQFKVKQELDHTMAHFADPWRSYAKHDFPWLEQVGNTLDGHNGILFVVGFFYN